jgi:hypothetical protein
VIEVGVMTRRHVVWLVCALVAACTESGNSTTEISHEFEPFEVGVGEEQLEFCQSWKLENDEPIYVAAVSQSNGGGWHHSNWFFVPEGSFMPDPSIEGADATEEGTWRCEDRGFRERTAASLGGVFFAQSTQTFNEEQRFPSGAALVIPPRSVIVGGVHLLNVSGAPLTSSLRFDLDTIPESEVETPLQLVNLSNGSLSIPAGVESEFGMTCDVGSVFEAVLGEVPDYKIYYVLPHYHEWGNYFRLSAVDEDGNDRTIYELRGGIGEPLGGMLDPPFDTRGAQGLRMECGYFNDTEDTLTWGFGGKEMCETLVYIDGGVKMAGGSQGDAIEVPSESTDRPTFETVCGPLSGVSDLGGGGGGLPACGAGNSFLGGETTASTRVECDVADALLIRLDVELSAVPLDEPIAGQSVDIEVSARVDIDPESAALLDAVARGEPAIIVGSGTTLEFTGGTVDADPIALELDEVPCEVDYSSAQVTVVPPSESAQVRVAEDATEITIAAGDFTLITRTPAPTYLTTGELPEDPMGQILTKCTATEATLSIPVTP